MAGADWGPCALSPWGVSVTYRAPPRHVEWLRPTHDLPAACWHTAAPLSSLDGMRFPALACVCATVFCAPLFPICPTPTVAPLGCLYCTCSGVPSLFCDAMILSLLCSYQTLRSQSIRWDCTASKLMAHFCFASNRLHKFSADTPNGKRTNKEQALARAAGVAIRCAACDWPPMVPPRGYMVSVKELTTCWGPSVPYGVWGVVVVGCPTRWGPAPPWDACISRVVFFVLVWCVGSMSIVWSGLMPKNKISGLRLAPWHRATTGDVYVHSACLYCTDLRWLRY